MKEKTKVDDLSAEIYRLAKPRKKGLLGLIFSRFLLIGLLLVLEVLIVVVIFHWLHEYLPHFMAIQGVFTIVMLVYLFNSTMDSTAKLTWMFVISILPIPGAIFLMFTQTNLGHRMETKRIAELIDKTRDAIPQPEGILEELHEDGGATDDLVRYLNRSGCFPAYGGTAVTYFPLGEKKFEAMLEDLRKAEKYIFMEYFIIEEGYMWGEILRILTEKAAAGVDIRVMYDGMCEMSTLPPDYAKLLKAKGIEAKAFSPIMPILSSHYNYRDHRKILVIDGKVAYNGGVNLADEYINRIVRFGHWKDTALRIEGPAVKSFTLMFLQMWNLSSEEKEPINFLDDGSAVRLSEEAAADLADSAETEASRQTVSADPPSGYVIPFCDCPLDRDKVGEAVYMDILNRAETYVHIMTPYLILDGELETALCFAAQRGVDVKLILPGIPDKKMAYSLAKSHYSSLLGSGVRIYEYTPGFVHAKVFVSDDKKAVVGTINLDYRSLYHHFECATYLYKVDCISEIEADFQDTLSKCRTVTRETVKSEKAGYKIAGALMKFIAPLM